MVVKKFSRSKEERWTSTEGPASGRVGFWLGKIARTLETIKAGDFATLFQQLRRDVRYVIRDRWAYVYVVIELTTDYYPSSKLSEGLVVRTAQINDIPRIQKDLYPYFGKEQEYDKRYIEKIGQGDFECFIAEKNSKIVSYFIVFNSAINSPLMKTPINRKKVTEKDAFLSSVFTIPDARGLWIMPHVVTGILDYFRKETHVRRVLGLAHQDTPRIVDFWRRFGFSVIKDPYPSRLWFRFLSRK